MIYIQIAQIATIAQIAQIWKEYHPQKRSSKVPEKSIISWKLANSIKGEIQQRKSTEKINVPGNIDVLTKVSHASMIFVRCGVCELHKLGKNDKESELNTDYRFQGYTGG